MSYKYRFDFSLRLCLWITLIFSGSALSAEFRVARVEPANWWIGMKYHQVQLLVYGKNIGQLEPVISYPDVSLSDVARVENPNYLFVTLDIGASAKPGKILVEFQRDNETKVRVDFKLWPSTHNSAERQGFTPRDAIYLITPDRFANGNPANDAVKGLVELPNRLITGGRHGGDIAGMAKHLDYIAAMGFTQIWSNPLTENNQPDYSYHGYAATDLYKIDARYGSNEEFRHFVAQAGRKGIGVIQDVVLNHIGSKHWWMTDLPTQDWLNFPDHYVETSHRRTTVQDPYAAPADKETFVSGWFVPTMPDLNQRNPLLATYLIQNSIWWIEYAGLSGIREDTFGYADAQFLTRWAKTIVDEYPHFSMVGEEWSGNPALVAHWQRGKVNPDGHIPYMPSMMDFPIQEALRTALTEDEAWGSGLIKLYETLAMDFLYPDPFRLVIFSENHDTSRLYSFLNENLDLFKMGMVYLATMRGIPQFLYGSEILMTSPQERDDGAVRADMPGGWKNDKINAFTGRGLSVQQRDAQDFLRRLLNWRKKNALIHSGKLQHFVPQEGIYVYFRFDETRAVMVVLNKNKQEKTLDLERFQAFLKGKSQAWDVLRGSRVNIDKPLLLAPVSSLIIELQ